MTQHRLLLAIADTELAQSAVALMQEGEGLQVVDRVSDAEEAARALRRLEIDVVVLHDALGGVPVMEVARDISASFPEVGLVLIAADDSPDVLRAAMHAGLRDVVTLPLSLEQLEGSVRAAAQWSRTMRERVAGEESAGAALGGQLIAVAGSKGGAGTTTVALQLALAAVRAAPGRPVCVVDFDLQKGDFRSFLDMPHRRSVVDLVEVADEISVRHLQETLYTHKEGFRVLLAPDDGERAEEVDALVARSILSAVKARHALTIVDLGANVSEASAIGAEIANRTLVVTQPDVVSLRGVKRLLELWKRLQVREDDDDVLVVLNRASRKLEVQPDLARKVIAGRLARTTIPADFSAFEAAVNTGTPARMEDAKLRASFDALLREADALPVSGDEPEGDPSEPRGLLARLGGERGQGTAEMMGLLPALALVILALWQVGLLGYTYLIAGHAAREGSRELAVNTENTKTEKPFKDAAEEDLPRAWLKDAKIEIDKKDPVTVNVKLKVPIVLPGLSSPWTISEHSSTSVEDEPLPPSQTKDNPS
jgi:pilus assembly protein CpaE